MNLLLRIGLLILATLGIFYLFIVFPVHAEPVTISRTMTWQQWRSLLSKCHVRAAGPITFPTPQPPVGTVISIFFSGEPEQIRCADQLLGATPTP